MQCYLLRVAKKSKTRPPDSFIRIRGARQHNLKNLDLEIPHGKLTVVTGPSGSGKSSLAFHTLYAEGQRRYVETFSPYVRQFFDRMDKPDVDSIEGILPAIAIEQKNHVRTTRSTVGTLTEINDYLKVFFARAAEGFDPQTGETIRPQTPDSAAEWVKKQWADQAVIVLFPITVPEGAKKDEYFALLNQQSYLRVFLYGKVFRTDEAAACHYDTLPRELMVVQDRLAVNQRNATRLLEALETAARFGKGEFATILADTPEKLRRFSNTWTNPSTGLRLMAPTSSLFSFNSPRGACEKCRGFGRVIGIDLGKAIPDTTLSIRDGAVKPFQGERGEECQRDLLRCCKQRGVDVKCAWDELSKDEQEWVKYGDGGDFETIQQSGGWYGIKGFFDWLETKAYKMHVRIFLSRYRSYTECPACRGKRLRPEALCFRIGGKTLPDLWHMPVCDLQPWMATLPKEEESIDLVRREIFTRLRYLNEVGLGYLTLDRQTRTLSGGEMERVNLTTCLGASLTNTLFVLDEPTVGLHARDIARLVGVMHGLRDKGNTLVVVEHEEAVMRAADGIIDIGPVAGEKGGEMLYHGPVNNKKQNVGTIPWLDGRKSIALPAKRRALSSKQLTIQGASRHNLRRLDVSVPLERFVVLSGVSGSGKSTLAHEVIYLNLAKKLRGEADTEENSAAPVKSIQGMQHLKDALMIDQSPIVRTPRSTPAVYCGVFEMLRNMMGQANDISPGYFSFNSGEGRCDRCSGAGYERVEMQFLSDIQVKCPDCQGKRYRESALQYKLGGKSIADILEMTVSAAIEFLHALSLDASTRVKTQARKALELLHPLQRVGLGYLTLGQPLNTISGGEAQRLKLSQLLNPGVSGGRLLILDEPTTGLHVSDVAVLLKVFHELVDAGNSLLVIEHQMDVIAAADWVIDLGPGAGNDGGRVVAQGTPEEIIATETETTRFLREKILPSQARSIEQEKPKPPSPSNHLITLRGARHHNLKNISLDIPRDELVVISGLSGSGKSTLAFDILFAEGQRRFLDSMSAYARQFADQLEKPEIDHLGGLPPTVAIEQRISQGGRKSTVATITEVWNFIRLLYAKLGTRYCCGHPVERQSRAAMEKRLKEWASKGPIQLFAPLIKGRKGYHTEVAQWATNHGYDTLLVDKQIVAASSFTRLERFKEHDIDVLIAEIKSNTKNLPELLETAMRVGKGMARVFANKTFHILSETSTCHICNTSYEDLDPRHFSFNSQHGWCETCHGYGMTPKKSIALDVARFDSMLAAELDQERAIERLDDDEMVPCPDCHGTRLRESSANVRIGALSIGDLTSYNILSAAKTITTLPIQQGRDQLIARDILPEIAQRLAFMEKVGLGYLQLNRSARTLSGGESQRIRLAAQLGSNLRGVLYVLDEPTIGLHPRDNASLLDTLIALRDRGNSLVVVEHDEDTIARADTLIDLGPGAGRLGGQVVYQGAPPQKAKLKKSTDASTDRSPTVRALSSQVTHPMRGSRRSIPKKHTFLTLEKCCANNLKNIDFLIPLGRLTVLTGVSGSGKSSFMHGCLALAARGIASTNFAKAKHFQHLENVYEVDQSPIGKTSRSCPATYVGIFDEIRKLFAQVSESRARGYEASRFSFNTDGGRCEECKGNGRIKLEMDFLPSTWVLCDTCQGRRYNSATLEVRYREKSIADVLEMTIDEASLFFEHHSKLGEPLRLLRETGLGYLSLGQASPTLSGGEAQRIKLISEIARGRSMTKKLKALGNQKGNLYLIEEPSVGLHLEDVHRLIDVLHRIVDEGHTVVVIEHHMAIAAEADWVIDIGKEAGENGGTIVAQGSPEKVAASTASITAPFLREML